LPHPRIFPGPVQVGSAIHGCRRFSKRRYAC
jgi:hypothetical protein